MTATFRCGNRFSGHLSKTPCPEPGRRRARPSELPAPSEASGSAKKRSCPNRFTFGPDAATVALDHPLDSRQPDARAGELFGGVQSLERLKELVRILRIKACDIIANEINRRSIAFHPTELDAWRGLATGELPGVPEEVFKNDPHQLPVCPRDKQC